MRIRTIKPEWLLSETVASLSSDARTLSVGLILMADDEGRGRAGLPTIVAEVWRYHATPELVQETYRRATVALRELSGVGFVTLYEVDGKPYFELPGFAKHQVINKKTKSKIPPPSADSRSTTVALPEDYRTEQGTGKWNGNREVEGDAHARDTHHLDWLRVLYAEWKAMAGVVPGTGTVERLADAWDSPWKLTRFERETLERAQAVYGVVGTENALRGALGAFAADSFATAKKYPFGLFAKQIAAYASKGAHPASVSDFSHVPDNQEPF